MEIDMSIKILQKNLARVERLRPNEGFFSISVVTLATWMSLVSLLFFFPAGMFAQAQGTLPVATTIELQGGTGVAGEVVIFNNDTNTYFVSETANDARVYSVTALSPALVFVTGSGTVAVVSSGLAHVQVNSEGGAIERGDLLTTSDTRGVAKKAAEDEENVFAIALESFPDGGQSQGTIAADIGIKQAQALRNAQLETSAKEVEPSLIAKALPVSTVRYAIATLIAVGALMFILYSFRSTIAKGVVSIGRNPKARMSIMTLAFGNILFALILCAVAIFVAIGVLVLPL